MSGKSLKGEVSPLMPMIGVMVMTLVFGTMAIPIQDFFSSETDEAVGDLDRMTTAKTSAQLYFYNYVPTAATYSAHNNSYNLAKEGGGEDIDWSSDVYTTSDAPPVYRYNPGGGCSTLEILNKIECQLGENVTDDLRNKWISGTDEGRCTRPDYELDVYFDQASHSLEGSAFAFSPIETRCDFTQGRVRYQANNSFLSLDFDVAGNRYIKMAEEANRTLYGLYNEWSSDVNDYYVATETQCDNIDYESAEEQAVSNAESDITQAFNSAPSSSSVSDMMVENREIAGPSTVFSEGTTTDVFAGTDSQSYEDVGGCNFNCGEDNDEPCDRRYRAEVNITVQRSDVDLMIKDRFSKIPVDSGKRYMEFSVDEYQHFYQED